MSVMAKRKIFDFSLFRTSKAVCILLWASQWAYPAHAQSEVIHYELPSIRDGEFVIEYHGFSLSYDEARHVPLWVAYELTQDETDGDFSRSGKVFLNDDSLSIVQADGYDFRGTGWSRGHMAPAADFKWSDEGMTDTFYYTNVCPQDPQLNNRYWNTLENKVRGWARSYGRVYVVTGPVFGENRFGKIGSHEVQVPDAFYKAILVCNEDGFRSIAFVMENTPEPRHLKDCVLTVNALEVLTGIDFFPALADKLEEEVEDQLDARSWGVY